MSNYIDPSRLQLEDVIGQGAFGVVLRGSFRDMDGQTHEVAIKQIVDETAPAPSPSAPTPKEKFMSEVSITIPASKDSDHVVHCHGWTATRDGKLSLVMRLYDKSLHALIDKQGGRALPLHEVVAIALDMAKGLLELHTKGIVFEDMKPSNVLLDVARRAFLADFGVSKPMKDLSKVYTKHTAGTYFFMPPEKLRPRRGANVRVGFPGDIWAYGVTVMQLLCSDLDAPYGPGIDVPDIIFMLHMDKEAPRVPAVPDAPELQHTLQACMHLDYNQRPTAAQLVQALQRISNNLAGVTQPSVSAAQGSSTSQDARAAEALQVQLAAAEARAAAAEARAAAAEAEAAAARRRMAEEAQQRQQMAREVEHAKQEKAAAAARAQQQQQQQQALRPLQLLSSPTCRATLTGHSDCVRSVAYTPDGLTLASGSVDSTIKLWSVASRACNATLQGHSRGVNSVAISWDGRLMASGSRDNTVKLWDLGSRTCTATLTGHTGSVSSVAISPDGTTLASGSSDRTIKVWDPRSGSCKALVEHGCSVECMAFSLDGALLASKDSDGSLRVWDARSARSIAVLGGKYCHTVEGVVFSPDGAAVLSGSLGNISMNVWDVKTRQCLRTLQGHTGFVNSVAVTPGGQHAVSGAGDNTIKIWDWRGSGRCLATLESHSKSVNSVATSPDGKMLASGSTDNTLKLWRIAQ